MNKQRDYRIDILRCVSILLILLAHSEPPNFIFQIRSFDVILMTLMMSASFFLSYKNTNYLNYVFKRFKRLILPAWIFLTIFFTFFIILELILKHSFNINLTLIIKSYSLLSGIGYVWIIRIFFTISLVFPLLLFFSKRLTSLVSRISIIVILLIFQELVSNVFLNSDGVSYVLFNLLFANSTGYIIVALIGLFLVQQSKKENLIFSLVFFTIFAISTTVYNSFDINAFKYPPRLIYLSFGLLISFLLWIALSINSLADNIYNRHILWLSKNSLNIYYWHIIAIYLLNYYITIDFWLLKFVFIASTSIIVTILQNKFLPNLFNVK